jgi:hypothetical protein
MTLSSLPNLRSRRAVSEQNRLVEVWRQPATGAAGGGVASYCSPFVARNDPRPPFLSGSQAAGHQSDNLAQPPMCRLVLKPPRPEHRCFQCW